ncbi:hypothetical protein [Helicobacter himalayensis]|uniref:hypothetical protein n=1 Tax=Helicobacter himalayensis TaxID=1591088 RepID=UPI0018D406CF|nr:hypothetical protein [Helicobacter himalayensis]
MRNGSEQRRSGIYPREMIAFNEADSHSSTTQQETTQQTLIKTKKSHKMLTTMRLELLNGFQLQFSKFDNNSNIFEVALLQHLRYYLGAHFSLSAHWAWRVWWIL